MSGVVSDPDVLSELNGQDASASPAGATPNGPFVVSDPELIKHLESLRSAAPADAVSGPNGLMWNQAGGYDPQTGELVVGGKPFTTGPTSAPIAAATGVLNGVPVAGPALQDAAEKAAAGINAATTGTPYDQNVSHAKEIVEGSQNEHPNVTTAANVAGTLMGTLPLAETAIGARGLGLVGSVPGRVAQGAAGGAALGAADAATRGQDPKTGAALGGGLGVVSPVVGMAVGNAANGVMNLIPSRVSGPIGELGATARSMLGNAVQGETPSTLAVAHDALGPNGFVGDLNNPLSRLTKSVADQPDAAAGAVREAYNARTAADGQRIDSAITGAFGPEQNLAALTKSDKAARSAASDPLYDQWKNTVIPPTDETRALIPRLNAAGVADATSKKMAIAGQPANLNWFKTDPATGALGLDTEASPTAQAWDYMKQSIQDKIDAASSSGQKGQARLYQGLKNDLIRAVDDHPDPTVAGVWKQARQAWSDPSAIISARQNGYDALKRSTNTDELRDEFGNLSQPEQKAFLEGARGYAAEVFGATKNGDTTIKNQLLAPNAQKKLQFLVGPDKADAVIKSLNQEDALAAATKRITGGPSTNENYNANVLTGPAAIPGKVAGYVKNFALDRPGSWVGMVPGQAMSDAEGRVLANARSQIAPILTAPNGPNAEMVRALLGNSSETASRAAKARQIDQMATMLINGGAQAYARQRVPELAGPR